MEKILGLDVGTKTIGVATGQQELQFTTPLKVLSRKSVRADSVILVELCKELNISEVVVGLPLMLDGTEGRSARLARQIGEALVSHGLIVHYQDERFSTVEAHRRLLKTGRSARKRKKQIDAAAAAVILEAWFYSSRQ
ncbi:MAG: Holliday junction resolvase RuvX [Proteobacteria bacterium]|nr:Holliday junction resolvase RuvX [Pseudomonadota bacterium]